MHSANSMESTKEPDGESWTRHTIDATIPMQDLIDSYMVPFQSCVEKGKVTSLMCSCASALIPAPPSSTVSHLLRCRACPQTMP